MPTVQIDMPVLVRLLEQGLSLEQQAHTLHRQTAAHFRELQVLGRGAASEVFGGAVFVENMADMPEDFKAFITSMFSSREEKDRE